MESPGRPARWEKKKTGGRERKEEGAVVCSPAAVTLGGDGEARCNGGKAVRSKGSRWIRLEQWRRKRVRENWKKELAVELRIFRWRGKMMQDLGAS